MRRLTTFKWDRVTQRAVVPEVTVKRSYVIRIDNDVYRALAKLALPFERPNGVLRWVFKLRIRQKVCSKPKHG